MLIEREVFTNMNQNQQGRVSSAIIGLGRIASLLEDDSRREKPASHAGAVSAHPEAFIAAGMDSDPERRDMFRERWSVDAVFDDASEMLKANRPDILHICTHADSHPAYLNMAVDYRIPVVILEKPVSDSFRQAGKMKRKLVAGTTRVVVNHERRYSKDYLAAREIIRTEKFGPLRSVTARLYMGRERPVEAVLLYDGTHLFDIISFLLSGSVCNVKKAGNDRSGKTLFASAECRGIPVFAEVGSGRDHVVFEVELSFETGKIRIGNGIYEEWESRESPYYDKMRSLFKNDIPPFGVTGYFSGMYADAVSLVKNPEAEPVSSFDDGLESLRIVEMIRKAFHLKFR